MSKVLAELDDLAIQFVEGTVKPVDKESFSEWMMAHRMVFARLIIQECIETIQKGIQRGVSSPENIRSWNHIADIAAKFEIDLPLDKNK